MPIIPPIAPAPTIQIFTAWFLITKEDRSAHRSRAGYPGFCKGALTSRLVRDRGEARDEKSVLNKLRVQPDFVVPPRCEGVSPSSPLAKRCRRFPPLAKGGRRFPPLAKDVHFSPPCKGGVGGVGRKPRQSKPPPPTSREGCRTIKMRGHERVL